MFLESEFYSKHKSQMESALAELEYNGDPLEFITDFQLSFLECKMSLNGYKYLDIVKRLRNTDDETIFDFLSAYQYFLRVISNMVLDLPHNMYTIKNKEDLIHFIRWHFDGSFPRIDCP